MEKVSAIIINHNNAGNVRSIMDTLKMCHRDIYEVTIVDDASTDDSISLISSFIRDIPFRTNLIKNSRNLGAAASRNRGIQNSEGELLLFIDSDISISPSCVEELIDEIMHDNIDITFPKIEYENGLICNPVTRFERKYVMNSAVFLIKRKSLFKMDMCFDEAMRIYNEDSDFFLRAHAFGLKSNYIENARAYHPFKTIFPEESYFHRVKNTIYLYLKLRGFVKYKYPFTAYIIGFLLIYFLTAILNRHFWGYKPVQIRYRSNRFNLLRLYLKAVYWNIAAYRDILSHRHKIRSILNNNGEI